MKSALITNYGTILKTIIYSFCKCHTHLLKCSTFLIKCRIHKISKNDLAQNYKVVITFSHIFGCLTISSDYTNVSLSKGTNKINGRHIYKNVSEKIIS